MTSPPSMDCVTHLPYEGRDLYIVGTAHVSQRSVDEVRELIATLRPDTVCVELDPTRRQALEDPRRWRNLDIFQVIRERKFLFLLISLVLSGYQRRLGAKLGVRPGAEMLAALRSAQEVGAEIVLADRDIRATLRRTWHELSLLDRLNLLGALVGSFLFPQGEITEEQVEALKDRDTIGELIREFAEVMPRLQRPLIDERDRYLMSSIREAPGQKVVAVVGAGHVAGMVRYLHEPVDRESLSHIPPPSLLSQCLKWVIPALVLWLFYRGYAAHEGQGLKEALLAWVIPNATLAGLLCAVAGARVITVLCAAVASPITSLNPLINAGMVAAFVEAWLRRPSVADCEGLGEISSLKDWYANRFTRVLLVGLGATVGSALGGWVGLSWVALL